VTGVRTRLFWWKYRDSNISSWTTVLKTCTRLQVVYTIHMARVNVYVPDELAKEARKAGLNVSAITQKAISAALAEMSTDAWLTSLARNPRRKVTHMSVLNALDASRAEASTRHG
jgi:post-segregation antitoxin (ccd killing protein)